jgi:aminocarboxymuconate-semialdehyde decarboxylase
MPDFFSIDIHTHIIPEHIPDFGSRFGYGGFVRLEHLPRSPGATCCANMMIDNRFFRTIQDNCWDPEVRIRECTTHKVDMQVLSTIPVMFSYWAKPADCLAVSEFLNDHIAGIVARYPDRYLGLGTLPMQDPAMAIKELERCREIGLSGIQIGSHINDKNLGDPSFFELYAACEALDMCVFVHPWDMMGQERMQKYWLPWLVGMPAESSLAICSMIFGGVFEKFPGLRVAFAHGGGSFPITLGRIQHGFDCRPDLVAVDNPVAPKEYVGRFWIDSLVHDADALRFVLNLFGAEKVCLGSDYPFPLGEESPGKLIRSMGFSETDTRNLLASSAIGWLGRERCKHHPVLQRF